MSEPGPPHEAPRDASATAGASPPVREGSRRRLWLALALVLLVAGGIRFFAAARVAPVGLLGDEKYYLNMAVHVAGGEGHRGYAGIRALRPPAFAWLLSNFLDEEGLPLRVERFGPAYWGDPEVQRPLFLVVAALGTALALLTTLLGRELFDLRTGLLAGLAVALSPTLVAYSHFLWSEMLFASLVSGGLLALLRARASRRWLPVVLAGLCFGAATLTREVAVPVAAACGLWWWLGTPRGGRAGTLARVALLAGVSACVVLPWTWRNYRLFHRFVPVSTVGWFTTCVGNHYPSWNGFRDVTTPVGDWRAGYYALDDEVARMEYARATALERIRAEQPLWIVRKLVRNVPLMLDPDSVLFVKLRSGDYGAVSPAAVRALLVFGRLHFLWLAAGAFAGVLATRGSPRALVLALVGVVLSIHVLTMAHTRFQVPWMGLAAIFAAHATLSWRALPRLLGRRERAALAACLCLLAFAYAMDLTGAFPETWGAAPR